MSQPQVPRQVRPCVGCGQHDDHPRAIHVLADGITEVPFHYDCHALIQPDCPACGPMAKVADGRTGDELIAHLATLRGE